MLSLCYKLLILTPALSLALVGCLPGLPAGMQEVTASPQAEEIALPAPRPKGEMSLEETLSARRSVREFTEEELTLEEISQLLWAAQGITVDWGGRTAPSAGALYPLEVYVATTDGLYHYVPQGHGLQDQILGYVASLQLDVPFGPLAVFLLRPRVDSGDDENRWSLADGVLAKTGPPKLTAQIGP